MLWLAACGGDGLTPDIRYRMVGVPAAANGACPENPTAMPPAFAGAVAVRLTYLDAGTRTLRCDAVVPLGATDTVLSVPDPSHPVDLVAEYVDDAGAVLGRGQTLGLDLSAGGTVDVRVAASAAFGCAPDRLSAPRAFHSATRLPTGEVLFLGGLTPGATPDDGFFLVGSAELYTPSTGLVRPVTIANLTPRAFHQAYVIGSDSSGVYIAVIGGLTVSGDPATVPVAVVGVALRMTAGPAAEGAPGQILHYDPTTSTFTASAITTDVTARAFGSLSPAGAPAIADVGGLDLATQGAPPRASVDRVDPQSGASLDTLPTRRPRVGASVTALGPGTLIVWGGDTTAGVSGQTPELGEQLVGWDGTAGTSPIALAATSETGPHRAFHGAALAGDGSLIVAGGFLMDQAQAITPVAKVVQRIASPTGQALVSTLADASTATPAGYGAAITVGDGDVIAAGGNPTCAGGGSMNLVCATGEAWRYHSDTGTLAATGPLGVARYGHTLTVLDDGTVLAAGGLTVTGGGLAAAPDLELYEPRGTADDPLAPAILRAPGDVARDTSGAPLAPCAVVQGGGVDAAP